MHVQVSLYAEFRPTALLHFLHCSKCYHLETALDECRRHGLVREQVYVLGRMGRTADALQLIVNRLHDVPQAIEFVNTQGDDSLWDALISLTVSDAGLTAALLDQIGGYVDPLRLVRALPDSIAIPRLSQRLARIINNFRTIAQLSEGCHAIIVSDCMLLSHKLARARRRPLAQVFLFDPAPSAAAQPWSVYTACTGARTGCAPPNVPRDALSFRAPQHTLGSSLVAQIRAHAADGLSGERPRGRSKVVELCWGMHSVEVSARAAAANRDAPQGAVTSSLRVWLQPSDSKETRGPQ